MEIVVRGRHLEVSERFRDHVVGRLERLEGHGFALQRIDVEVTKERNPRLADQAMKVELTCRGRGPVVRAEYATGDKFVAFDAAADRLEERLRRSADRRRVLARSGNRHAAPVPPLEPAAQEEPPAAPEQQPDAGVIYAEGPVIVREKTHATEAMSVEQALDAMELVGHDFYLFLDEANGKPSVVYRRRGYSYGLIRLEVAAAPVPS
jgi:ribosomal subunit interface protein